LANAARVPVSSESESQLQSRVDAIFVLEIQTEAVNRDRLAEIQGEGLCQTISSYATRVKDVIGKVIREYSNGRNLAFACRIVAHIIPAEIDTHLETVISASNRQVIHDSPLCDVAALRKD